MTASDLLAVKGLTKEFQLGRAGKFRAVDSVSFQVKPRTTLALVGESGCGKTTTGRLILRLLKPTQGSITFQGADISALQATALRRMRRNLQVVFQNPNGAFNPRLTIGQAVEEPLVIQGIAPAERRQRAQEALQDCELELAAARRYPHQLSGGQQQRAAIARAIVLRPKLIVADEPVSALDASIQSQILNLLLRLQASHGISYLLISHDLAVVSHIADYVGVMYMGRIVEYGPAELVLAAPAHPYTQALLDAVPQPRSGMAPPAALQGLPPLPLDLPRGCPFASRCKHAAAKCFDLCPPEFLLPGGRTSRCWLNEAPANRVEGQG